MAKHAASTSSATSAPAPAPKKQLTSASTVAVGDEPPRFSLPHAASPGVINTCVRQFRSDDLSLLHATASLFLSGLVMIVDPPTWRFWTWADEGGFFTMPVTPLQRLSFSVSISYFLYDTYWILVKSFQRKKVSLEDYGYLLHHFACIYGLIFPAIYGKDGAIVAVGFFFGELSNPPRAIADFITWELAEMRDAVVAAGHAGLVKAGVSLEQCSRAYAHLYQWQDLMASLHFGLFVACRVYLVKYVISIMVPMCELQSSKFAAVLILIFSFASVIFIMNARKIAAEDATRIHLRPFAQAAVEAKAE